MGLTELLSPDEKTLVKVAVADLGDRFPSLGHSRIERVVSREVHRWFVRARIKTYVGIIAGREARSDLERSSASMIAAPRAARAVRSAS